ncbi:MAG: D-alanine--D-alanine ligase [Candidatus Omnitrophica bacterium]|nr:D-alanine--D-alanine ligase [Candidatus Omnitrophota bacterium]
MKKVRVGVLAGGPSSEREISLRSGKAVHNALLQEGVEAFFIDVRDNIYDIIKSEKMDVAFLALHGKFGEDGTVQKILESAGIRYTGSDAKASKVALDKIASKEEFIKRGIPTPKYMVVEKDDLRAEDLSSAKLPLVVKPQFEGSSIGLSVVKEAGDLKQALDRAFEYGTRVIIEEYISGRELTVGILNDEPLPVIEIRPKARVYDYKAKYNDPDTQYLVPAPIPEDEEKLARSLGARSHAALGCRSFSRTDMMMDGSGRIFVLEVNTIPGMTVRSLLPKAAAAIGVHFNKLCLKLLEDALKA